MLRFQTQTLRAYSALSEAYHEQEKIQQLSTRELGQRRGEWVQNQALKTTALYHLEHTFGPH